MEAMDLDRVYIVMDLRTELFELVDDLTELKFSGVDEFTSFLKDARGEEAHARFQNCER